MDLQCLIRIETPGDGSCLFHAICNAYYIPYIDNLQNRVSVVRNFRKKLSEDLHKSYDSLQGGNVSDFSRDVEEFSLPSMTRELDSDNPIGYGYMEYIGNSIGKDIYVIDAKTGDLYVSDESRLAIKGDRDSIVLYYTEGHYELVGVKDDSRLRRRDFKTHFSPKHPLIRSLYARAKRVGDASPET